MSVNDQFDNLIAAKDCFDSTVAEWEADKDRKPGIVTETVTEARDRLASARKTVASSLQKSVVYRCRKFSRDTTGQVHVSPISAGKISPLGRLGAVSTACHNNPTYMTTSSGRGK